jgi:hypothetical protein
MVERLDIEGANRWVVGALKGEEQLGPQEGYHGLADVVVLGPISAFSFLLSAFRPPITGY